jgi:hypothetical protein
MMRDFSMSTLVLNDRTGAVRRPRFFRMISEFLEGIRLARAMAHQYDVLSRLSDGELARRGLRREDIPQAVVSGNYNV